MADDFEDIPLPQAYNKIYLPYMIPMRNYYKDVVYPEEGPRPIDLWHERPYYGRVDTKGRAVYVSETNLTQLAYSTRFLLTIDFVADAFKDFMEDINVSLRFNNFSDDSFLRTIKPINAWVSFHNLYHEHFSAIHQTFVDTYLSFGNKGNKVKDFNEYMKHFISYFRSSITEIPFTKTAFLLSKLFPPTATGLMIDLLADDHSRDSGKYEKYIQKVEFDCYRNTATKYGFYIDKNAPWRLVANIGSVKMQSYMMAYHPIYGKLMKDYQGTYNPKIEVNLAKETLFDLYYYPVKQFDYETFKLYMFQSYHSYVNRFPFYEKYNEDCSYLKQQTIFEHKRKETFADLTTESNRFTFQGDKAFALFSQKYDDLYWLPKYLSIRLAEAEVNLTRWRSKYIKRNMLEQYRNNGIQHALNVIESVTNTRQINIYKDSSVDNLDIKYFKFE